MSAAKLEALKSVAIYWQCRAEWQASEARHLMSIGYLHASKGFQRDSAVSSENAMAYLSEILNHRSES